MKKPLVPAIILTVYFAILIRVMVFKDMPTIRIGSLMLNFSGTESGHPPNFIPFKTILPYLTGHMGLIIAGVNLAGNIALLVPVGFLIPFIYQNANWKKTLVLAVASGLIIELMQVVLDVGIFDIDDVILNALGVMIGYWSFIILAKWVASKKYTSIAVASILIIAAVAGAIYFIYPKGTPRVRSESMAGIESGGDSEDEVPEGGDLCNGTGGTGEIVNIGANMIAVRLNNGDLKNVKLTSHTKIRTSAGVITSSDLKAGERVTLIIDESETASVVLVCNTAHPASKPLK